LRGRDPVGQTLKVNELPLTVVGVEAKRGSFFGDSLDNHLYMPITTSARCLADVKACRFTGKSTDQEALEATIEEARLAMRNRHKLVGNDEDDFGLVNVRSGE
jgi:putative ABC transport system permease protein